MKISVVLTILNEEKTIEGFLESLSKQSLMPDEIVIVDGGSNDETIKKIKNYELRIKGLKLIIKPGANRSVGRNIGIESAENDVIAVTDAGCILDKDWLENIIKPFADEKIMAVAGYYKPICKNVFQKCLAPYFCVMDYKKERDPSTRRKNSSLGMTSNENICNFLPSSRSVAFRKKVWKEADGYPQDMNYCEDLVFDQKVIKTGYKFHFQPNAIVFWPMKTNLKSAFKQFFNYAYGDGQVFFSYLQTHSIKITTIFLRYIFFLILLNLVLFGKLNILVFLFIFIMYIIGSIVKNYKYVKDLRSVFYLPIIQLTSDLAVMAGTVSGIISAR